jgi:hypothetical protein
MLFFNIFATQNTSPDATKQENVVFNDLLQNRQKAPKNVKKRRFSVLFLPLQKTKLQKYPQKVKFDFFENGNFRGF